MFARGFPSSYRAALSASCKDFANSNYSRTYATPGGRGCTGLLVRPLPQLFCFPYLRKNGGIHPPQKCRRADIRSLSAFRLSVLCVSAVSPSLSSPLATRLSAVASANADHFRGHTNVTAAGGRSVLQRCFNLRGAAARTSASNACAWSKGSERRKRSARRP
jgi:hypothetical protein